MDCISFYEEKLKRELQRKDLIIINLERLLESIERSIADVRDKKEITPYAGIGDSCDSVLSALYEEKRRIEEKIENYLYSIAPSTTTLIGYRILAKMLAHSGSLRALAFMPASRLQIMGAEKGLFSGKEKGEGDEIELGGEKKDRKTPKHGYIFQHPLVKGADKKDRGKNARKLACSLAIALRKDYFSHETEPGSTLEPGSKLEPGKMYSDEALKPSKVRTNEKSKLFYLFKIRPELVDNFKGSVLYLGAGSGTTVKKLARISKKLYCVELSPFPFASLIEVAKREQKKNICPILEDANKPESYADAVKKPDLVYQDITQKNQVEIFLENMSFFSVKRGVLMIKASSIDSMKPANLIFEECRKKLSKEGYKTEVIDLRENFRNHAAIIAERI